MNCTVALPATKVSRACLQLSCLQIPFWRSTWRNEFMGTDARQIIFSNEMNYKYPYYWQIEIRLSIRSHKIPCHCLSVLYDVASGFECWLWLQKLEPSFTRRELFEYRLCKFYYWMVWSIHLKKYIVYVLLSLSKHIAHS